MRDFYIDIKKGYYDAPKGISFYRIKIEPKILNYSIKEEFDYINRVPLEYIKRMASEEIANSIIDRLTYHKRKHHDGLIFHEFSIKDYTITERKEKEQIIFNLTVELNEYKDRLERALNKYHILKEVYEYNNRKLYKKIIEWLLYDKEFKKVLK